jgi:uncharacterized protein with gpF-like domain
LPRNAEREYRSAIFRALEKARELVNTLLIPRLAELEGRARITVDHDRADVEKWAEALKRITGNVREQFAAVEPALENAAAVAANTVSGFNKQQVTNQLRGVLGVDIFLAEPELADTLASSINENVALIKSIPEQYFSDVEGIVLRGFRSGQRSSVLGDEIADRFGAFIARDQVESLNGDLTRNRQIGLGIPGYIWRTALDERVRDDHLALENTRHSWDNPPVVDSRTGRTAHPGGDFNCRCVAEPDLQTLL